MNDVSKILVISLVVAGSFCLKTTKGFAQVVIHDSATELNALPQTPVSQESNSGSEPDDIFFQNTEVESAIQIVIPAPTTTLDELTYRQMKEQAQTGASITSTVVTTIEPSTVLDLNGLSEAEPTTIEQEPTLE